MLLTAVKSMLILAIIAGICVGGINRMIMIKNLKIFSFEVRFVANFIILQAIESFYIKTLLI